MAVLVNQAAGTGRRCFAWGGGSRSALKSIGAAASLAVLFGAAEGHAQSLVETGEAGLRTCLDHIGDRREAQEALVAQGWRFERSDGGLKGYSKDGRRLLVVHGELRPNKQACGVMVRKMTSEQAAAMAKSMLGEATSVKSVEPTQSDSVAEWTAVFRGKSVRFAATRPGSISINHGAAVLVSEE